LEPVDLVQKVETPVYHSPRHGSIIQNKESNKVISENDNIYHVDEVFEAYITRATDLANTDADTVNLENKRTGKEKKESRAVLQELKTLLVSKQMEWRVREAKALARQQGTDYSEPEPVPESVPVMASGLLSDSPGVETGSGQLYNLADIAWAAQDRGHQRCPAGVFFSDTSGSDSDSGLELLGKNKLFRRPLRPAAIKYQAARDIGGRVETVSNIDGRGKTVSDRQINIQPVGFDSKWVSRPYKMKIYYVFDLYSSLAAAAVAVCLQMRAGGREGAVEESFGDSYSDVDN
jgi:hypothetical protein